MGTAVGTTATIQSPTRSSHQIPRARVPTSSFTSNANDSTPLFKSLVRSSECVIFINNFHELMVILLVIDTWNENMLPFIIMSLYIYVKK